MFSLQVAVVTFVYAHYYAQSLLSGFAVLTLCIALTIKLLVDSNKNLQVALDLIAALPFLIPYQIFVFYQLVTSYGFTVVTIRPQLVRSSFTETLRPMLGLLSLLCQQHELNDFSEKIQMFLLDPNYELYIYGILFLCWLLILQFYSEQDRTHPPLSRVFLHFVLHMWNTIFSPSTSSLYYCMFIASVAFVDIACFFLAGICMTALIDREALYGAATVAGGNIT